MVNDLDRLRQEYASREERLKDSQIYSYFNPAYLFMIQQREREVMKVLCQQGWSSFQGKRIFELGCGRGKVLGRYLGLGAQLTYLTGVELIEGYAVEAHRSLPGLPVVCADGQSLPYASGVFDLVLQSTVFSSVLDDKVKRNLAREMVRVLRPQGGVILWYDFWLNPGNPQTRGIRPAEIRRLFPNCEFAFRRITLAPPIARSLAQISVMLCAVLERLGIFNSHYLVAIQPKTKVP